MNERAIRSPSCRLGRTVAYVAVLLVACPVVSSGTTKDQAARLRLTLPPVFYAVPGCEIGVYYDNLILAESRDAYRFEISCDVGTARERRWTLVARPEDVGTHAFSVTVRDKDGRQCGQATTRLHVVPADAGRGRSIRLLIVGDSLTHATLYVNEVARLLSLPGNPTWTMLGTHRPARAADGVAHEGYGGWTWQRFVAHYEPHPDGTYKKRSSPFVYLGASQKPVLDVKRYIKEQCQGEPPDYVVFLLGINDCFGADRDSPKAIDARIDAMLGHADRLLAAFHRAAPHAVLGVCLTTPPNRRDAAFNANYKGKYTRAGWKRIQHRLVQREIRHFGARKTEQIYVVPTELNLDVLDGYPATNAVHPNQLGYRQIAASIYAWLKAQMHGGAQDGAAD